VAPPNNKIYTFPKKQHRLSESCLCKVALFFYSSVTEISGTQKVVNKIFIKFCTGIVLAYATIFCIFRVIYIYIYASKCKNSIAKLDGTLTECHVPLKSAQCRYRQHQVRAYRLTWTRLISTIWTFVPVKPQTSTVAPHYTRSPSGSSVVALTTDCVQDHFQNLI